MAPKSAFRELISGRPGSKTYLDVNDSHAAGASMIENTCGSGQKGVFGLSGVDGNDSGLTVHAQDGGVGRMNWKLSNHITLPSARVSAGPLPVRIVI